MAIVRVPLRSWPVFDATRKATEPLPVPPDPEVTVTHGTLLVAAHEQVEPVDTATGEPAPPPAATDCDDGSIENEQPDDWSTVNVHPPIVTVPLRAVPEFAATFSLTVPLPLPLAPEAMVIQVAWLVAFQEHDDPAVTVTSIPFAPPDDTDRLVGLIVMSHDDAPAWLTVSAAPPIVTVAVRGVAAVLAATLNPTEPEPVPLGSVVIVTHDAPLLAVQVQPAAVVTATVLAPPADPMESVVDWRDTPHTTGGGPPGGGPPTLPAASWVNVAASPPTLTEPLRAGPVFAATVTFNVPGPVPALEEIVIHPTLLDALQAQPGGTEIEIVADPPLAPNRPSPVDNAMLHGAAL